MKAITFAVFGIATAFIGLVKPVQAQSSRTPNSREDASSLSGSSLMGIDMRTSQEDFDKFFGFSNPESATLVRYNETLTRPDSPVYLQPAQQSVNGNEGVQVQLDLRDIDRQSDKPSDKTPTK
ncbi:hypothetical protein [Brunnivagina elsteri]|uniref:Uncharacterized protein n=1 Tax=Brunnivagina elsteri CCALA 953 TaxID=987040 RepID=A0A2A2TAN1_9CYAN|nr:hypothetical protein [Calothrix elsteri]PAX48936.1 hypothetical protein CK510_28175 [Calothrix elsteri CCALA 953]